MNIWESRTAVSPLPASRKVRPVPLLLIYSFPPFLFFQQSDQKSLRVLFGLRPTLWRSKNFFGTPIRYEAWARKTGEEFLREPLKISRFAQQKLFPPLYGNILSFRSGVPLQCESQLSSCPTQLSPGKTERSGTKTVKSTRSQAGEEVIFLLLLLAGMACRSYYVNGEMKRKQRHQ